MTVNVDIRPDLEAQLVERARSCGQSLEGYIQRVLERDAVVPDVTGALVENGVQKAEAFRTWARSFPVSLPPLSLESISRENIYHRD